MPVKITDRTMVYVLFVVLAILSLVTIAGNRAASDAANDAARAARTAVTASQAAADAAIAAKDAARASDGQVNSHRVRNDAEHKCLLIVSADGQGTDVVARFDACVEAESHGTVDPDPVD